MNGAKYRFSITGHFSPVLGQKERLPIPVNKGIESLTSLCAEGDLNSHHPTSKQGHSRSIMPRIRAGPPGLNNQTSIQGQQKQARQYHAKYHKGVEPQ